MKKEDKVEKFASLINFLAFIGMIFSMYYTYKFCIKQDYTNMISCILIFIGLERGSSIIVKEYKLDKNID